jgi:hypothetical protein
MQARVNSESAAVDDKHSIATHVIPGDLDGGGGQVVASQPEHIIPLLSTDFHQQRAIRR